MSAGVQFLDGPDGTTRYRVSCAPCSWEQIVDTPQHAANSEAYHNRINHADDSDPISVDLTAAAIEALDWEDAENAEAALDVWKALIGLHDDDEAFRFARSVAAADPPITATIAPF